MSKENNLTPLQELRNTARHNRKHLIGSTIIADICGSDYIVSIAGIGMKAVKMQLFIPYEDILKFNHHKHLENVLIGKINKVYRK